MCSVRCAVCGVRCAVCGVRSAVCGVRCVVCDMVWCGAGRVGSTPHPRWHDAARRSHLHLHIEPVLGDYVRHVHDACVEREAAVGEVEEVEVAESII